MSNVRFNLAADNRLLAEFMGWKLIESDSEFIEGEGYWEDGDENHICDDGLLSFDSWDDLMEVVDKIGSIVRLADQELVDKLMDYRKVGDTIFNCSLFRDIDYVYGCCTSFVKWYNANVK